MLSLSDMSGRSMVPGFESYITGYRVPDAKFYAFARTWYAPEMERPGCVWTQTLLIELEDLGQIKNPALLRDLFRRPSELDSWDSFQNPLEYVEVQPKDYVSESIQPEMSRRTLSALYFTPDRPVFVPAMNSQIHETLVLALWAQQWGALRARFTFCTGSLSSRSIGAQSFDLQVVPLSAVREVRRQVQNLEIIDAARSEKETLNVGEWLAIASSDLVDHNDGLLRSFLTCSPGSQACGREAFVPLTELSLCFPTGATDTVNNQRKLVDGVGNRFPGKDEASRLKNAIAGADPWLSKALIVNFRHRELLEALAMTEQAAAFDLQELAIGRRGRKLCVDDPEGAKGLLVLLIRENHNAVGEELLSAMLDSLDIKTAESLASIDPGLLSTIVRRTPSRAAMSDLWIGSFDRQRELFDAATSGQELPVELQKQVVQAMLEANSDAVADKVFRRFGGDAIQSVLEWYDSSRSDGNETKLKPRWIDELRRYPDVVVSWLSRSHDFKSRTAALVAEVSNPHSGAIGSMAYHRGYGR
jgi:hypothetical protein